MADLKSMTPDEQQAVVCDNLNAFLRSELSQDALKGQIKIECVVTNDVTGRIDVVTGNIELLRVMKSLFQEALEALQHSQLANALIPLFKTIRISPIPPSSGNKTPGGIIVPH